MSEQSDPALPPPSKSLSHRLVGVGGDLFFGVGWYLLLIGVATLLAAAYGTWIAPRWSSLADSAELLGFLLVLTPFLLLVASLLTPGPTLSSSEWRDGLRDRARTCLRAVGITHPQRVAADVLLGLLTGVASWVLIHFLIQSFPESWQAPTGGVADPRPAVLDPLSSAARIGLCFLAIAPREEVLFRVPLLLICAATDRWWSSIVARRVSVALALVAASALFGYWHLGYTMLNAVAAGISGMIYGAVALWRRSLFAGIAAHGLYDAIVLMSW